MSVGTRTDRRKGRKSAKATAGVSAGRPTSKHPPRRRRERDLPVAGDNPFPAVLGIMLFPGRNPADRRRARAFAVPVAADGTPVHSDPTLPRTRAELEALLAEVPKRMKQGIRLGQQVTVLFALYRVDPRLAYWRGTLRVLARLYQEEGVRLQRSELYRYRLRYADVIHLWGAWYMRLPRFKKHGFRGRKAFRQFLAEAEGLRSWALREIPRRRGTPPRFSASGWRAPAGFLRRRGRLRYPIIPRSLWCTLRPSGRPRGKK